jgi:transposase
MLAELVDHVVGVDPDRDSITIAVVGAQTTAVLAQERFTADAAGYQSASALADQHSIDTSRCWAVEGTGSYGRGLPGELERAGEMVIEFDQPRHKPSKSGAKSDALDAIRAAREALGRERLSLPRAHSGHREAIRVHTVARDAAVRSRTAAINELKSLVVTADEKLRGELRGLGATRLTQRCARFRTTTGRSDIAINHTRLAMQPLARRIEHLDAEIVEHDEAIKTLIDAAAPQLVAEFGIGYITAATFYLAWSHPGRCRSEAAFARLAGVAPIEATSGQNQQRHRLCRTGDRKLNQALHVVALVRKRADPTTRAYIARRTSEGKTDREATRCIKRYLARRVWRLLEHPLDRT